MTRGYAVGCRNQWCLPIPGVALLVGSALAALTLPGSAAAEESQTVAPASQQVVSLRLLPGNPHLWGAEASQRFLLLARFADGWSGMSPAKVASVSPIRRWPRSVQPARSWPVPTERWS